MLYETDRYARYFYVTGDCDRCADARVIIYKCLEPYDAFEENDFVLWEAPDSVFAGDDVIMWTNSLIASISEDKGDA